MFLKLRVLSWLFAYVKSIVGVVPSFLKELDHVYYYSPKHKYLYLFKYANILTKLFHMVVYGLYLFSVLAASE